MQNSMRPERCERGKWFENVQAERGSHTFPAEQREGEAGMYFESWKQEALGHIGHGLGTETMRGTKAKGPWKGVPVKRRHPSPADSEGGGLQADAEAMSRGRKGSCRWQVSPVVGATWGHESASTRQNAMAKQVRKQSSAQPVGVVVGSPMGDYGEDPLLGFVSMNNRLLGQLELKKSTNSWSGLSSVIRHWPKQTQGLVRSPAPTKKEGRARKKERYGPCTDRWQILFCSAGTHHHLHSRKFRHSCLLCYKIFRGRKPKTLSFREVKGKGDLILGAKDTASEGGWGMVAMGSTDGEAGEKVVCSERFDPFWSKDGLAFRWPSVVQAPKC